MKTTLLSLWLPALILQARAADAPPLPQSLPKRQSATITAVATAADKRILVIRYEIAGVASEERITFAREIADFRYCPWMGAYGMAIVARTGTAETTEYFYSTLYFGDGAKDHKPAEIPAPPVVYPVLGIGNTGGDSIVITAVQHGRGPTESISGWVYIDNCPSPHSGVAIGHLTPFTVPAERPQPK